MRSLAEIDRDFAGMYDNCERQSHGCTYPRCNCSRNGAAPVRAEHYPEHDRTSCSDAEPINAEAGGSLGCARCTALLLDQRDELLAALRRLLSAYREAVKLYDPNTDDAFTVDAHNAIARASRATPT